MAATGSKGFYGIGTQSGKGLANINTDSNKIEWVEAITAPFGPAEEIRTRRPVIGADPYPRDAYKTGTGLTTSVGFEVTPEPIGQWLYHAMGQVDAGREFLLSLDTTVSGGTFTLDVNADSIAAQQTTAANAWNISASDLESAIVTAIELDANWAAGSAATHVDVVQFEAGKWYIRISSQFAAPVLTLNGGSLTPAAGSSSVTAANDARYSHDFHIGAGTKRVEYEVSFSDVTATGGTFDLTLTGGGLDAPATASTLAYDATGVAIRDALRTAVDSDTSGISGTAAVLDVFHIPDPAGQVFRIVIGKPLEGTVVSGDGTLLTGPDSPYTVDVGAGMTYTDKFSAPYFTVVRGVGEPFVQEIGRDCKIATGSIAFVSGDAVMANFTALGLAPIRSDEDNVTFTPVYDTGDVLTVVNELSKVDLDMGGGNEYSSGGINASQIDILSCVVNFSNNLTPLTRRRIGSKEAIDLQILDRTATVDIVLEISDSTIYDLVYYNANYVSNQKAWNSDVLIGSFLVAGSNAEATPDRLMVRGDNVNFNGTFIINEPMQIVTARLQGVVLHSSGGDSLVFNLVNDVSMYGNW